MGATSASANPISHPSKNVTLVPSPLTAVRVVRLPLAITLTPEIEQIIKENTGGTGSSSFVLPPPPQNTRIHSLPRDVAILRQLLSADTEDLDVITVLSEVLIEQEQYEEVLPILQKGVARYPSVPFLQYSLGFTLRYGMRLKEALFHTRLAIAGDPTNLQTHLLLADILFLLGEYTEAFLYFRGRTELSGFTAPFTTLQTWGG